MVAYQVSSGDNDSSIEESTKQKAPRLRGHGRYRKG